MASVYAFLISLLLLLCCDLSLSSLVKQQPLILNYHNGVLLKGNYTVNLIWYGNFSSVQRAIVVDFIDSLSSDDAPRPSASSWWKITGRYLGGSCRLTLGDQTLDESYAIGKSLVAGDLQALAGLPRSSINFITVILTSEDVQVDGFCMSRCGTHGSIGSNRLAYVWVGNSVTQCPGYCAWPFHRPIYGPQTRPLVSPNADVGVDGMIINLASLLANTVTNPFNEGYFLGPSEAPLEAASACTGQFGFGFYPGYPGRLNVDHATGGSFNANGVRGRKYLLPAILDPLSNTCSTPEG